MKKNGFTLIELLAVIALLGVLIVIAIPAYSKLSTKTKNNLYNEKIDSIEAAAILYAKDREEDIKGGNIEFGQNNQQEETSTEDLNQGLVVQDNPETFTCPAEENPVSCVCPSTCAQPFLASVTVWYLLEAGYLDNEGKCSDTPTVEQNSTYTRPDGQKATINNGLGRKEYCDPRDSKSMREVRINLTRQKLKSGKITYRATIVNS